MKRLLKIKKVYFGLFLVFVSALFAYRFYQANSVYPVGDQTGFIVHAQQINFNYLYFAIFRYMTWSSRLLIESATMYFSLHELIFIFSAFLATLFLLICSRKLCPNFPLLPGVLLFLFFPRTLFVSAGAIPTYTNYIFPASLLIFSLYYRTSKYILVKVLSMIFFVFSIMQEQLAVYSFLWLLFECVRDLKNKSLKKFDIVYLSFSILAILSVKLSPGNSIRIMQETQNWFPNFKSLNIIQKISLGILETGENLLTISKPYLFILFFLVLILIISLLTKRVLSFILSIFVILLLIASKLKFNLSLYKIFLISKNANKTGVFVNNIENYSAVFIYLLIFIFILLSLYFVVDKEKRIWYVYLLTIGMVGRMLVSFSPTIYASGARTHLPVMISLFIISCSLLSDIIPLLTRKRCVV